MQRRRKVSLQEQIYAREKVLADIRENEDENGAIETILEEPDTKAFTGRHANNIETNTPFLHKVVADGDLELLTKLVESGSDVNVCDDEGWPPLNTAIRLGKTECAALLLKHGAGDFFFQRQKDQYLQRLQVSKKTRRKSHWM